MANRANSGQSSECEQSIVVPPIVTFISALFSLILAKFYEKEGILTTFGILNSSG